ncbi:MAG: DISARM system SNF2-like helicase DrmD [Kofleriaceae bacterium]|nr:DISARM system SNF2-like helicase DrmD [Kofleriaceae bacterium]MBP9167234.1 DISARM system SNF2-like helicase DrmD [Kofleriaceae bacterium]
MGASSPTAGSVLIGLTQARLLELARGLGVTLPTSARKDAQIARLLEAAPLALPGLLGHLYRDELRAACKDHGLPADSRARAELARHLLTAAGLPPTIDVTPPPPTAVGPRDTPAPGDVVVLRRRTWLVDAVHPPIAPTDATRVALLCLDDDHQGRRTEVLWELELGARVLSERDHGLGDAGQLDPPRTFSAYYNALRWNMVTATDARLFQAPFRAGVHLMNHQLTPLKRALELPRANLFIADDVGLGKTIEAGLVMQELLLRNQIDTVLIVAPASVCPQWQREMSTRFGQAFELYNRAFVQRRRQDRGFGVNPWVTHARFVISYQTLRRPEYKEPLHQMLREGRRRTLLILDEAHTAAPASSSRYAVFSDTTRVVAELAPLFDHRLFLSATPHNGHSNSFSTLLALLDRQRFTRGVPPSARALETVMVRRLKADLRGHDVAHRFPEREVLALELTTPDAPELELARLLAEYTARVAPSRGRDRLAFINLQKRLLSSVPAFCRTLDKHAPGTAATGAPPPPEPSDDDDDDLDDELRDAAEATADAARAAALPAPDATAADLLTRLRRLALQRRELPCAKVEALVAWLRANLFTAPPGRAGRATSAAPTWNHRRVIIFTEYGDTKTYLVEQLAAALGLADDPDERDARIATFHGGMSDDQRAVVQRAWNGPPDEHPVRILIATDAAREGLNLQGYCADLFHFDVPWNPARMEQRNGRIDRALQPAPVVRCHYFVYRHRAEDVVLDALVKKVATIQRELGSLATVVQADLDRALARGIDATTLAALDGVAPEAVRVQVVTAELETQRDRARIERDLKDNARILEVSRRALDFSPALLRETLTVGLELAVDLDGAEPLAEADGAPGTFSLPALPATWQRTLDTVRPPREHDEDLWDWRRRPPLPVVFEPPAQLTEDVAHLHLSHPVTQRILSRLLAQGFSARDLTRVTALVADVAKPVALALARLSLFGPGAARLHDAIIDVAAWWDEARRGPALRPLDDADTQPLRAELDAHLHAAAKAPPQSIAKALAHGAAADFAALWPALEHEADAEADRARKMLATRARTEADAMRELLSAQEKSIQHELAGRAQLPIELTDPRERAAWLADTQAMTDRLAAISAERATEPERIAALYDVALTRVTPIGLVYLWPGKPGKPDREARS